MFIMSVLAFNVSAETVNDAKKVSIRAVVPDNMEMSEEATSQLKDKLKRIITSNGFADNGLTNRFVFTSKVNVVGKDIVSTSPARVSVKLDVSFYIGDVVENVLYESTSMEVVGVGINENKAFLSAIKEIPVNNKGLRDCISKGKLKIVDYYSSHCKSIIQNAECLSKNGKYEAAIAELVAVPNICEDCYRSSREKAVEIYSEYIDIQGEKLIKEANAAWMLKQDYEGAEKALNSLSKVDPLARCSKQADSLMVSISDKLRRDEERDREERTALEEKQWNFMMRQYNDMIEMQKAREVNETKLMDEMIDAVENVGCAYGANQPEIVNNTKYIIW